jgi:peptide/nickel transport system permease protein
MAYVLRRIGQGLVVLWASFTAAFILLQMVPGNGIMTRFENPDLGLTHAQILVLARRYGAFTPVWEKYIHSVADFVTGNFGDSLSTGLPVTKLIGSALPNTFTLAGFGLLTAVLFAMLLAFVSGLARMSWLRELLRSIPSVLSAVPAFWLAIMLIEVVSFRLKLIPIVDPGPVRGFILPVLSIGIPASAPLAQVLTRSIDETLLSPFVTVIAAKGASRRWILWRDVARNAILPTLTIAGVLFGALLSSAIVTETIFGLNGLGLITTAAVTAEDTPVLQAVVVISAAAYVVINLIVDLLYPLLDPRLKRRVGDSA